MCKYNDTAVVRDTLYSLADTINGITEGKCERLQVNQQCDIYLKFEKEIYGAMHKSLERIKDEKLRCLLITLWNRHEKNIKVGSVSALKTECRNDKVFVHRDRDFKENKWFVLYQALFHECFHAIDYHCIRDNKNCLSFNYKNEAFDFYRENYQFGKIVNRDLWNTVIPSRDDIHKLKTFEKTFLYGIMGGVLYQGLYPHKELDEKQYIKDGDQCGHEPTFWPESRTEEFHKKLAIEAFASMADAAVTNPRAMRAIEGYLPNACNMFKEILKEMVKGS